MFRGHYEHAIDSKGRTSLPARFRELLASAGDMRLVVTPALFSPCLDIYPLRAWEEFEREVANLPKWDRHAVLLRRRYVSAAVDCELDRQGRVLIPSSLREYAGLAKEVLWAGMGPTIELWSRDQWADAMATTPEDMDQLKEVIGEKLGL